MRCKFVVSCAAYLAIAAVGVSAQALVVSPGNMNGWTIYTTNSSGALNTGSGIGDFVTGPATPPLGTGSAHLQTPSGGGDQSVQFRNIGWAGTRVDTLTELSYSTYASAWNGQQLPYLTIWLDTDGIAGTDDRLWFEPDYSSAGAGNGNPNPQPNAALGTWQTWDALGGMWYSDDHAGPGSNAITLSAYLTLEPNATIVDAVPGTVGGIRITSGFASAADSFNANIDEFTIGTSVSSITYDFEPAAVPEASPMLLGGLAASVAGLGLGARRAIAKLRGRG